MDTKAIMEWASTQKRITARSLQARWDLTYEEAVKVYHSLKDAGIIRRIGYVVEGKK